MKRLTTEEYVEKVKRIHPENNHSFVVYTGASKKITVICPKHGKFEIQANNYLQGQGCKKCGIERRSSKRIMGMEEFIRRAKEIHGDKYDYSKVAYINCDTPVSIICPEHGEFWQTPHGHLNGNGCPYCKSSKLEKNIRKILKKNDINFDYQKRFPWLGLQSLDFYLPDYNVAIECQGRQHFESVDIFGGEESLRVNKERDVKKYYKCKNKGVNILYITFPEYMGYKYKV